MKKLSLLIISFLLVLAVLAGCSGGRTVKAGYISVLLPDGWEYRSDTFGYAPSEGHFFAEVKDEKGNYVWYVMHPYNGEHTPKEQLEMAMENSGAEIVSWLDNIIVSDMEFTAVECELDGKRSVVARAVEDGRSIALSITDLSNKDILKILDSLEANLYHYEDEFTVSR